MFSIVRGPALGGRGYTTLVGHWTFVLGAYVLVFGVLLAYWWRVESGIRALEREPEVRAAGGRP